MTKADPSMLPLHAKKFSDLPTTRLQKGPYFALTAVPVQPQLVVHAPVTMARISTTCVSLTTFGLLPRSCLSHVTPEASALVTSSFGPQKANLRVVKSSQIKLRRRLHLQRLRGKLAVVVDTSPESPWSGIQPYLRDPSSSSFFVCAVSRQKHSAAQFHASREPTPRHDISRSGRLNM
jgi:hypothetical protein